MKIKVLLGTLFLIASHASVADARIITYGFESNWTTKLQFGLEPILFNVVRSGGVITVDTSKHPKNDWIKGNLEFEGHIDWNVPLIAAGNGGLWADESGNFNFDMKGTEQKEFDSEGRLIREVYASGDFQLVPGGKAIRALSTPSFVPLELVDSLNNYLSFTGGFQETVFEYDEFGAQTSQSRQGAIFHEAWVERVWIISQVPTPSMVMIFISGALTVIAARNRRRANGRVGFLSFSFSFSFS